MGSVRRCPELEDRYRGLPSYGYVSNPDPGLARLVPIKCVFSYNVGLEFVGLEFGSI